MAVDLAGPDMEPMIPSSHSWIGLPDPSRSSMLSNRRPQEPARDARDEAPATPVAISRPDSPYLQPTIDFDGLSWPSE